VADHTQIEWTDATWNPITGCSVVSAGCKHCYAMKLAGTRLQHHPSRAGLTVETKAGPVWSGQVRFNEQWLDQPMKWKRPRRIFVCAHGDLFHESVPFDWIDRVFAVMALAPHHTFQVLTKRPARMLEYIAYDADIGRAGFVEGRARQMATIPAHLTLATAWPFRNVWLGVSVEDQATADERIPLLLETPAAVRWISAEPLLGPVDLTDVDGGAWRGLPAEEWLDDMDDDDSPPAMRIDALAGEKLHRFGDYVERCPRIDWAVAGGESGTGARPMHPDWARSLRDQCADASVPFLFKQWGAWAPDWEGAMTCESCGATKHDAAVMRKGVDECSNCGERFWLEAQRPLNSLRLAGKKAAGRLLDGVQHDGYPETVV
jgi:protein gp37